LTGAFAYEGAVTHRRLKPKRHFLKYRVFSFLLDVDKIDDAARRLRWFSRGRFNLFSFYDGDHGSGRPDNISAYVRAVVADAGYGEVGQILMLCYPRMLGYAFNPLTVYYCYDPHGDLTATLYEVRNTFGGRHSYLIPVTGANIDQQTDKVFHVSPFNDMDLSYRFVLSAPHGQIRVFIQTSDAEGPVLNASFEGDRQALSDKKLLSLFFRYPLMTVKVIVGIHWEAVKLLAKGLRLRQGAPDPDHAVTVVRGEDGGKPVIPCAPQHLDAAAQTRDLIAAG
jgi:DUF1365 family protein